jgi:hypothetical protein
MKFVSVSLCLILLCFIKMIESQAIWIDENHLKIPIPIKSHRGYCYSPNAERIKFLAECENACDVLLMTKANYEKLQGGTPPEYHFLDEYTLSATFAFYDRKYIQQIMCLVIRNKDINELYHANFKMSSFMIPEPSSGDNTLITILLGVVTPGICLILGLICVVTASILLIQRLRRKKIELNYLNFDQEDEETQPSLLQKESVEEEDI